MHVSLLLLYFVFPANFLLIQTILERRPGVQRQRAEALLKMSTTIDILSALLFMSLMMMTRDTRDALKVLHSHKRID